MIGGRFMKKFDEFLSKKVIKIILNFIFPILIGEIISYTINSFKDNNLIKIILLLLISISTSATYIFFIYRYMGMDKSLNEQLEITSLENNKFQIENNVYQRIIVILTSLFNSTAKEVNKIANNMDGKNQLENWNYKISCNHICNSIYELLCLLSGKDNFSVNIVLYDIKAKGKSKNIKMIAEKSKFETPSDSFDKTMYMCSNKNFYAVKLFNKNLTEPTILTTDNEIKEKFVFSDDKDHPKYTQYVGVPIHCNSNKMVSLLQISSFDDTYIGSNKKEVADIINNYILPFTYLSLLDNKIEKLVINSVSYNNELKEI